MTTCKHGLGALICAIGVCLSISPAHAGSANFSAGYNLIPNSYYAAIGYREGYWGAEAMLMTMGREEPTVRPGPESNFDLMGYLPWAGLFMRGGVVVGWGKVGYDIGIGDDLAINRHWAIRIQDIHFHATEDQQQSAESEHQISIGVRYQFQ
ncbi:hypothetical protein BJI67_10595 [Acidihalobacter aeolianus]|uniref:Outer membrane protein beta-barrel domain-containing protein n=2 Tax=Acidihalobacter aeolianus TaxID=2792603 RepID=A0A1D8K909_9GAMM|nr:hypothetical protein BJI67_10595 [Acidihalobacter aeolianus]